MLCVRKQMTDITCRTDSFALHFRSKALQLYEATIHFCFDSKSLIMSTKPVRKDMLLFERGCGPIFGRSRLVRYCFVVRGADGELIRVQQRQTEIGFPP